MSYFPGKDIKDQSPDCKGFDTFVRLGSNQQWALFRDADNGKPGKFGEYYTFEKGEKPGSYIIKKKLS